MMDIDNKKCTCGYHEYRWIAGVPWCDECGREADLYITKLRHPIRQNNDGISSVFEAVDATNEATCYTLGIWVSFDEAFEAILNCDEPSDLGSPYPRHEYYCCVEIRQRCVGGLGNGIGKKVAEIVWTEEYDEKDDEYNWIRDVKSKTTKENE